MSCLFCRIAAKEIPGAVVYEEHEMLAFRDINPVAPTHVLLIPKKHVAGVGDAADEDAALLGSMIVRLGRIAKELGLSDYRVVSNHGAGAGQSVFHLHWHLLGG